MSNSIMMNGNNSVCNLTMFSNHRLTLFEARDTSIKPTPVWHLPGMMKSPIESTVLLTNHKSLTKYSGAEHPSPVVSWAVGGWVLG